MKTIHFAVLFLSLSALAVPIVGDKVENRIEYTTGSTTRTGIGTIEITEINLDKARLLFQIDFEGQERIVFEEEWGVDELGYIESLEQLKTICDQKGGELGTGEIDGKTIDVCTSTNKESFIKYAIVPFGLYEILNWGNEGTSHQKLLKITIGQ